MILLSGIPKISGTIDSRHIYVMSFDACTKVCKIGTSCTLFENFKLFPKNKFSERTRTNAAGRNL